MFLVTFLHQISNLLCFRLQDFIKIVRLLLAGVITNWLTICIIPFLVVVGSLKVGVDNKIVDVKETHYMIG